MKTMKVAAAALLALAACTELPDEGRTVEFTDECTLTVDFSSSLTKATGQTVAKEDAINNVTLFVFRTEGGVKLDASVYTPVSPAATQAGSGTPYEVSLKCTVGQRKVYVLVNTPEDLTEKVSDEADLLSCSSLLADNGISSFFMMGSVTASLSGPECTLKVPVSRKVASVRLDRITNMMEAKAYRKDGLFVVNKVYLTNVVGLMKYDGTTLPSALASDYWLAKLEAQENALIYDGSVNATVNYGADKAYATSHSFYAYPNDCEASTSSTWSPRSTMLVVEATLDGVKYYYPVAVGPLESNRQYVITDFIIRRPGSESPWDTVHKADATVQVEVLPWGTPVTTSEEI